MSRTILTTLAAAGLLAIVPQVTDAGCGGYGRGGGYGGNHYHRTRYVEKHYTPIYHTPIVHRPVVVHKPVVMHRPVVVAPVAEHCFHPHHCYAWVRPGDSLDAICLREYGDASLWQQVAAYNKCSTLVTGQKLLLPSIYASGRMTPSTAPAPIAATPPTTPPVAAPVTALATPPAAPGV